MGAEVPPDERTNCSPNWVPSVTSFCSRGTHRADLIAHTLQEQLEQRQANPTAFNATQYIGLGEDETPKSGSIFQIILRLIRQDYHSSDYLQVLYSKASSNNPPPIQVVLLPTTASKKLNLH